MKEVLSSKYLDLGLDSVSRGIKDGIEIEKGAILNEEYLTKNFDKIGNLLNLFSVYPDLYIDIITPEESNFTLFFYQRIILRAVMRYKNIFLTAPRAFSKSFLIILGMMLQDIFIPGHKNFICAPMKNQSAQIAKEKILEIYDRWPLIRKEVIGGEVSDSPGSFGKDMVTIKFRNGSQFDVVGALESTRGGRRHSGLLDEIRNADEEAINTIVLPLINVSRRLPDNTVNLKEPNQQVISATSAGAKTSFSYDKMIDVFEKSIIDPQNAFCVGCDYRVPALHKLIEPDYIRDLKMSPSYNETAFATE